jgi:cysteinyl-tRNA synthetase
MIRIYNTLTKQKEEFKPLNPPVVNMYTCGVTVYDDCHIGHARSLYVFDVIRRYLKYRGYDVRFVRNITDVDDKIINRANDLKVGWLDLVEKYIAAYRKDLRSLGVADADAEPRATQNIPEMITYIQALIQKGFAYATNTGVYFSVRKFKGYGKLSGQSLDQMLEGVRKTTAESKHDPLDFALWKAAKEGEPFWEGPWGKGRPGWHIECSVMSQKYLKVDTLDIHAGGRDLVFPHHENEIAQSEALTGKPFANYWIHHGLLTIEAQKMSKSLGNFITIRDVLSKYPADVLKIMYLQAHYSSPVDFSWEKMEAAKKAYESIVIVVDKLEKMNIPGKPGGLNGFRDSFVSHMDDDFNTPRALSVVFDAVHECNRLMGSGDALKDDKLSDILYSIKEMAEALGLSPGKGDIFKQKDINDKANFLSFVAAILRDERGCMITGEMSEKEQIDLAIKKRNSLRKEKKYKEADDIRKGLDAAGVILEDSKDGQTAWRRKI